MQGYVDDARNTDNAWFETHVKHFHDDADAAFNMLDLVPLDPNLRFVWAEVNEALPIRSSHRRFIEQVRTACLLRRQVIRMQAVRELAGRAPPKSVPATQTAPSVALPHAPPMVEPVPAPKATEAWPDPPTDAQSAAPAPDASAAKTVQFAPIPPMPKHLNIARDDDVSSMGSSAGHGTSSADMPVANAEVKRQKKQVDAYIDIEAAAVLESVGDGNMVRKARLSMEAARQPSAPPAGTSKPGTKPPAPLKSAMRSPAAATDKKIASNPILAADGRAA